MKNDNMFPCIWVNGNADEVLQFYSAAFANVKVLIDAPMVKNLELDGFKVMLLNAGPQFKPNPSISFFKFCSTAEEVKNLTRQLSINGKVLMPVDAYDWSDCYAWIEDQFGVSWQIMLAEDIDQTIVPSFLFTNTVHGKCEEAIDLYTNLFPNSQIKSKLYYSENAGSDSGLIMQSEFSLNGINFRAMDSNGPHAFNFTEGLSMVVMTNDQEETDLYWEGLTANGGAEGMCGWLKDPFGVSWQIIPEKLIELMNDDDFMKAQKAVEAMMKMKKIIIADLD